MHSSNKIETSALYSQFISTQSAVRKVPTNGMDEGKRNELEQLSHLITTKLDDINKVRGSTTSTPDSKKGDDANLEKLLHHYIDTARNLNLSKSPISNAKQGKLSLKTSSTIGKWQEKFLILYPNLKKLSICKENEKHVENELDLTLFTVKWIGNSKGSKYCLELVQTRILSGQAAETVKDFVFSSKSEPIARDWFTNLVMLMNTGEGESSKKHEHEDKKPLKSLEAEPENPSQSKKINADSIMGRASFLSDAIISSGRQEITSNGKDTVWMKKEDMQKLKENMISNLMNPHLKEIVRDEGKKVLAAESSASKEPEIKTFLKKEEKVNPTIIEEEEESERKENNTNPSSEVKCKPQIEASPLAETVKELEIQFEKKHDDSLGNAASRIKQLLEGTDDVEPNNKPSDISEDNTIINHAEFKNFEDPIFPREENFTSMPNIPKVLTEEEKLVQEVPVVFQAYLREILKTDIFGEEYYNMFYMKKGMRVLQNTKNPLEFKLFLTLKFPIEGVLASLLEINKHNQWNKYIKKVKVLNKCDQNTYLISEERQALKFMLWPREFTYLRTICKQKESHYILCNSLDYKFPKSGAFLQTVQGYLKSCIILKPHPSIQGQCLMIVINQTDNKGYLKGFLNRKVSFDYIKEYQNLCEFLKEKSFFDATLNSIVVKRDKEIKKKISFKTAETKILDEKSVQEEESDKIENNKEKKLPADESDDQNKLKLTSEEKAETSSAEPSPASNLLESEFSAEKISIDRILESVIPDSQLVSKINDWSVFTQEVASISSVDKEEEKNADEFLEYVNQGKHTLAAIFAKHVIGINQADVRKDHESNTKGTHVLHSDFSKSKSGGLLYLNKKVMEEQKRVISFMIKKMGTNLLSGKSIMSVSLPVDIFDEHSVLKRTAISFAHAPSILERAGEIFDPMEQFKVTIAFLVSTLYTTLSQRKPFNPILGETFQARINGCPVVLEQISHHPPISAFYMEGHNYTIKGNLEMCASLHANSVTGKQRGIVKVCFKNTGTEIRFSMPPCNISGMTLGQRTINFEGQAFVFDPKNDLFCELHFNPDKKGLIGGLFSKQKTQKDFYNGQIMKINEAASKRIEKLTDYSKFPGLKEKEDILEAKGGVEGIWHENCDIMGKSYWRLEEFHPYPLEAERNPLPSDSRYREDVIMWKTTNVKRAQESKEKLENLQRADRKLRAKPGGGGHH